LAGELTERLRAIPGRLYRAGLSGPVAAAFAPLVGAVVTLWLVVPTVAPGVLDWDTAEFQTVGPVLGTGHPTGYPSYVILGFIASHLLPFGDAAYRMNLLQAILAAGVVAGTVAIVQYLTGMRWVALATGLLFLTMPTASTATVWFPITQLVSPCCGVSSSPLLWQMSTHADYHMLHLALVVLLFLLLLIWERWRTGDDAARRLRSDRWLVAAACVYGIAFANHGLSWLLPPAIALFVLAVAPRILQEWRLVLTCSAVLAVTIVVLLAEMPIRAAMHAPIVYGHPDSWNGFWYVFLAQQFPSSLVDPWGDLGAKYAAVMGLVVGWLGPLVYLAAIGVGTSLVRRPRYVLLSLLAAALTAGFAASYVNAQIDRYFLVPLFVAFTYVGLGLADSISLGAWLAGVASDRFGGRFATPAGATEAEPSSQAQTSRPAGHPGKRNRPALRVAEIVAAIVLIAACATVVPARQSAPGVDPGGVSRAGDTYRETWVRAVLAPADRGGLPENAVIVSWWSLSTTLWYGQRVEGLRPDIQIIDDSDRVNDNLGEVQDVIDSYLGMRTVFVIRLTGGPDGMTALRERYSIAPFTLPGGFTIDQVNGLLRGTQ
jgi:hypothetical protein